MFRNCLTVCLYLHTSINTLTFKSKVYGSNLFGGEKKLIKWFFARLFFIVAWTFILNKTMTSLLELTIFGSLYIFFSCSSYNRTNNQNILLGHHKCREQWPADTKDYERSFNILLDVILLILPLMLLASTYSLITKTLWKGMVVEKSSRRQTKINIKQFGEFFLVLK